MPRTLISILAFAPVSVASSSDWATLHHACRAACSCAVGNSQAAWRRRSWRNTKRSWRGGRRPFGWFGRNVAHAWSSGARRGRSARRSSRRRSPSARSRACPPQSPLPSPDRHRTATAKRTRQGRSTRLPAKRTDFSVDPANTRESDEKPVPATYRLRTLGVFPRAMRDPRHRRLGLCRRRAGAAAAAAGHEVRGFARSPERVAAAGVLLDDVVVGDAVTGAGLARALDGDDVAYYLIHSMEGPAGTGFAEQERRVGRALRHRGPGRRRAPGRLPRRARARHGHGVAPSCLAPGGRGGAARGGRRADRAARLDRDRRPLALVPLPRPADRAAAGAGAAGLAHRTAPSRSTAATCSTFLVAAADAPAALAGRPGTSPART